MCEGIKTITVIKVGRLKWAGNVVQMDQQKAMKRFGVPNKKSGQK